MRKLGEDVSEILEYVPASFKVIRHVRPKLSCAGCERIVQAAAPSRPIERGLAGPGLLAHVLVSKYCDHLPLYRQAEMYAREGVELERSTLADWVGGASQLAAAVGRSFARHVLAANKLHADDTPVPVLAPGNGKTKTGRLWTYVRDDRPAAIRRQRRCGSPTRRIARVNIRSSICATSAALYRLTPMPAFNISTRVALIQEAACWAHVRRKFYELHGAHASPIATEAMERIAARMPSRSEIRGRPPDERLASTQQPYPSFAGVDGTQWLQSTLSASRASRRPRRRSAMRARSGMPSYAIAKMAALRSITRPPNGHCEPSLWDGIMSSSRLCAVS